MCPFSRRLRREALLLAGRSPGSPTLGPWSQNGSPLLCIGLCPLPISMAEFRPAPGGRETPQGELRAEVVEDEGPRSPVSEEPPRSGSGSTEAKLSPREEEELDPRIQVRRARGGHLGGSAAIRLPLAQGVILESWDRVPHPAPESWDQVPPQAPYMEPASPSACVSASLSLCLS